MKNKKILIAAFTSFVIVAVAIILIVQHNNSNSDYFTLEMRPSVTDEDGNIPMPENITSDTQTTTSNNETQTNGGLDAVTGANEDGDNTLEGENLFDDVTNPDNGIQKELRMLPRLLFSVSNKVQIKRGQCFFDFEDAKDDPLNTQYVTFDFPNNITSPYTGYKYQYCRGIIGFEADNIANSDNFLGNIITYTSRNGIPFYFHSTYDEETKENVFYIMYTIGIKAFGSAGWIDGFTDLGEKEALDIFEDFFFVDFID